MLTPRKSPWPSLEQGLSIKLKFTEMTERKISSLCVPFTCRRVSEMLERSGLEENHSKVRSDKSQSYLQVEKGRK